MRRVTIEVGGPELLERYTLDRALARYVSETAATGAGGVAILEDARPARLWAVRIGDGAARAFAVAYGYARPNPGAQEGLTGFVEGEVRPLPAILSEILAERYGSTWLELVH